MTFHGQARPPDADPMSDAEVEALNDRLAIEHPIDDYYARAPWPIRFTEARRLAIIKSMIAPADGLDLLEVGVGGGHVLEMFPRASCTAVDVSGVYLARAKERLSGRGVRFLKGQVQQLPLAPESFDRIICTEVLEHTVDPATILAAINRLLRPDGKAVVTIPNDGLIDQTKSLARWSRLDRALRMRIDWGGDDHHLHTWTDQEFKSLLETHLRVVASGSAPFRLFPLRLCYLCGKR